MYQSGYLMEVGYLSYTLTLSIFRRFAEGPRIGVNELNFSLKDEAVFGLTLIFCTCQDYPKKLEIVHFTFGVTSLCANFVACLKPFDKNTLCLGVTVSS